MAAEEDGKQLQPVEHQGDHRAAMMAASGRQIDHFAGGRRFGEGQVAGSSPVEPAIQIDHLGAAMSRALRVP